ncbi:hypothetical protein A0J61_11459, partial [Choanephora cucurbitarum]
MLFFVKDLAAESKVFIFASCRCSLLYTSYWFSKRTRELIKKVARMNHGFKAEKHDENESEDIMHQNVPVLIKEPFSLLDLIKLSEIN